MLKCSKITVCHKNNLLLITVFIGGIYPPSPLTKMLLTKQAEKNVCIQLSDYLIKEMEIDMFLDKCLTGCS